MKTNPIHIIDPAHRGQYLPDLASAGFKALVMTGPIQGEQAPHFGRVVQIRKKSGAFGTNTVLLREADGVLRSYHNMSYFTFADDFLPLYEAAMAEVDAKDADKPDQEYTIEGQNPATGFVVHGLDDTNGAIYAFAVTTEKKSPEKP